MEDGVVWGACDPQPLQQVGLFNGAETQTSLLSLHTEAPYQQYWVSEAWRTDEISDIPLMSVDPLTFDPPLLSLPAVTGETIHDFAGAASKFSPQGQQWGHSEFYPPQDVEILNSQFMQFNSSTLPSPHLPHDFNTFKPFGTVTPVQQSRPVNIPYVGSSIPPCNRPVVSSNAISYEGSPVSMGMFPPVNVPHRIIGTSGMDGSCNSNMGLLQHLPKVHHPVSLASKAGGSSSVADIPGAPTFVGNQKCNTLSPLADSSSRRRDSVVEEPKMSSFNPGPYVNSARTVVPTHKQSEDVQRMWVDDGNRGRSSAVAIPNSGHRQQHQQALSSSSPGPNLGFEHRSMSNSSPVINLSYEQRIMSNSSPVTTVGFESSRHQKSMSNSSPAARMSFEHRPMQAMASSSPMSTIVGFVPSPQRPCMTSSSSVPIMGLQQQQPPMTSSSPIPIGGFEQRQQQQPMNSALPTPNVGCLELRQQPTMTASPPLSSVSFESRQPPPPPPMSSSPSTSNLVFEPRRSPSVSNSPTVPNLARQQPSASNPRPDSGESAAKWPLRMIGGCPVVLGSEKTPIMRQQPDTGTMKCALPRSTSANSSPGAIASPVNKRPLWADDNKNRGGSMSKKPMQKWQGTAGCSRLEEISAAAHQNVTQNTSGRALGPALNTNLKPRARQGSANDPQSIAARERRERISERLKVLQALIPNGDKVDMVTMLEKAITYVQCLELQIRMLKNDSLWPKALGPLPNTLQELLERAGPEFLGGKDGEEPASELAAAPKKSTTEVIEFDGHQRSADKE